MRSSHPRMALFDCDKTLVEISDRVNLCLRYLTKKHLGVEADMSILQKDDYCGKSMKKIIIPHMTIQLYYKKKTKADIHGLIAFLNEYDNNLARRLRKAKHPKKFLCDKVSTIFWHLRRAGIPIGVYTGAPEKVGKTILQVTGLEKYVGAFVSGDDREEAIKDCVHSLESRYRIKIRPREVAVFGDAKEDMIAARKYGAVPFGVLHASEFDGKELTSAGAKKLYAGFSDYRLILNDVFGLNR